MAESTRNPEQAEANIHTRCLEVLVEDFERVVTGLLNSPDSQDTERANKLRRRASAIRWALGKINEADYEKKMLGDIADAFQSVGPAGIDA